LKQTEGKIKLEVVKRLKFTGKPNLNNAERQAIAFRVFGNENRWSEIPTKVKNDTSH